ncbi:unnamed protein product [Soboliphyme baturini]|uniref:Uncharacterized protein n=1 Tax=Soboliphyme baturini TaxID=241478 RepID=A0A183ICA7_9BILA|nr:unnamed protein product [Soboliphyme baturini]
MEAEVDDSHFVSVVHARKKGDGSGQRSMSSEGSSYSADSSVPGSSGDGCGAGGGAENEEQRSDDDSALSPRHRQSQLFLSMTTTTTPTMPCGPPGYHAVADKVIISSRSVCLCLCPARPGPVRFGPVRSGRNETGLSSASYFTLNVSRWSSRPASHLVHSFPHRYRSNRVRNKREPRVGLCTLRIRHVGY